MRCAAAAAEIYSVHFKTKIYYVEFRGECRIRGLAVRLPHEESRGWALPR